MNDGTLQRVEASWLKNNIDLAKKQREDMA